MEYGLEENEKSQTTLLQYALTKLVVCKLGGHRSQDKQRKVA